MRLLVVIVVTILLSACQSTQPVQTVRTAIGAKLPQPAFDIESKDWGVAPTPELKPQPYHAPTPTTILGADTVTTQQVNDLVASKQAAIINVLDNKTVLMIPNAVRLGGAGIVSGSETERLARLDAALSKVTAGDKSKPIVFYCLSAECWLSYNATLRAKKLGYANAVWYRGGINAWKKAGLPFNETSENSW